MMEPTPPTISQDDNTTMDDNDAPLIKPISSSSIKRLVAGQAITDLSSSVKELVDNAIDANATRISIKLYNQGLECIELTDDGDGVPKSSREFMAMRHATSKLRQFEDLYNNNNNTTTNDDDDMNNSDTNEGRVSALGCAPTLGFRGEALFCLANLSRSLKVCTKTSDDDTTSLSLGETFCFNNQGQIIPESIVPTPRSVGTTVSVYGLMESLPVRRVDMIKRIKAQNMKLIKLMQGYAILCSGVQFTVTDVGSSTTTNNNNNNKNSSKNNARKKSVVRLSTSASNKTMDARVASVLGTKFLAGLTRIELDLKSVVVVDNNGDSSGVVVANNEHDENDDNNNNNKSDSRNNSSGKWQMTGLISHSPTSPNPGNARDIQFFSINGRPVDLPSVSRVIGDVWRTFDPSIELGGGGGGGNSSSSSRKRPACVLAFSLPASMYDVNLAPDKREVMFTEETSIIGCIREGLVKLWTEQSEGKFRANEVERRSAAAGAGGGGVKSSITKEESINPVGVTQHPITQNDDQLTQSEGNVVCEDITPKPSRKTAAAVTGHGDNGSFVTPGPDSTNANNRRSLLSSSTPSSGETNATNNEESHHSTEEKTIPIVQRDRATLQERRSWEQTQLNFRRIEKENLRQEMQRVLGPGSDGESQRCSQQQARRDIEDVVVPSAPSYEESTDSAKPRKSKRPKRQRNHDVSFLDKFAFGSKQQEETIASENENESGSEEDEIDVSPPIRRNEITSNSRGNLVGRGRTGSGARMLVGRPVSVTETSRTTSLGKRRTQQTTNETSKRMHVAIEPPKDTDTAVQPSETVWGNFSGTKNVILQSQGAYLSSRKMSTQLQSSICQNNIQGNSNDDEKSTLSLCKEDIRHMSIIGQFNLGFILARDCNNHLWILDQHACDEKYNFERLCKETVIHEQKLIAPLPMELSPSEEHCVLEHMDIFERNGFRFSYDPEKEPLHRLSLTALPHSGSGGDGRKAVQFGKEDVGALCAMLGADGTSSAAGFVAGFGSGADGSGMVGNNAVRRFAGLAGSHNGSSVMRLPKAIAMFASRACRGSIMIGTALSDKDQKKILDKLDNTDDPWTCAHGRPTMCHVTSIAQQLKDDDALASHFTAAGDSSDLTQEC